MIKCEMVGTGECQSWSREIAVGCYHQGCLLDGMEGGMTSHLEEQVEEKEDASLMPEKEVPIVYKDKGSWKGGQGSFTGHPTVDVSTSFHLRTSVIGHGQGTAESLWPSVLEKGPRDGSMN